jgi:ribonuclease P protein component
MTRRAEFDAAVRRGRRAGRARLVAHAYVAPDAVAAIADGGMPMSGGSPSDLAGKPPGPRVGFVVSRAVGGAVVRNRVARRLRHLVRSRLALLPPDTLLVIRALPPAANATSAELAMDLDAVLRRLRIVDLPRDAPPAVAGAGQ